MVVHNGFLLDVARDAHFFHHDFSQSSKSLPYLRVAIAGSHSHNAPLSFGFVAAAVSRSVVVSNYFIFDQWANSIVLSANDIVLSASSIVRPNVSPIGSSAARYSAP